MHLLSKDLAVKASGPVGSRRQSTRQTLESQKEISLGFVYIYILAHGSSYAAAS